MRRILIRAAVAVLAAAALVAPAAGAEAAADQVITVDQGNRAGTGAQHVYVFAQNGNWKSPVWSWQAPTGSDHRWGHLDDVKVRLDSNKVPVVLVTAGNGMVGSINYRTRKLIWHAAVPTSHGTPNPHSIELLPNGGVAVADTNGYVWYFPYGSSTPKAYKLSGAHGVLYSDGRLWAVGSSGLAQYDIHRTTLTQHGGLIGHLSGGHDLSPISGDKRHQMWVSDHNGVYTYDKYSGRGPVRVPGARSTSCVKSVGNQDDGTIVETRPGCPPAPYLTHTVTLFDRYGNTTVHKTRPASWFYKARPVVWSYY